MIYNVIFLPSGRRLRTDYFEEIQPFVRNARLEAKRAAYSLAPDRNITHYVYYGEKRLNAAETDVRIFEEPKMLGDEAFYAHAEALKPDYVGAIHIHRASDDEITWGES